MSTGVTAQVVSANQHIIRSLSQPRLASFRLTSSDSEDVVFARYRWNLALGQSFYPSLGLLEVTLRNHMHLVISAFFKTDKWYDANPAILRPHEQDAVQRAKDELVKQGKPLDPDRIVAELSFGFWTGLLGKHYETPIWYQNKNLTRTFSNAPKILRKRHLIAGILHRIRLLRNRISHHEPIFRMKDLDRIAAQILEMIQWLSPDMLQLLPIGDDFATIFNRGANAYFIPLSQTPALQPGPISTTSLPVAP